MSTRLACGQAAGEPVPLFLGCAQAGTTGSVPVLLNLTTVKNYDSSLTPPYLPPFATANKASAPVCSDYFGLDCGDGINNNIWCNPIPDNYMPGPSGPTASFALNNTYHNLYFNSGTVPDTLCGAGFGFKAVIASKNWNGRISYTSREWGKWDNWDYCFGCGYHSYDPLPDDTRYLGISAGSSKTQHTQHYDITTVQDGDITCDDFTFPNMCSTAAEAASSTVEGHASAYCVMDKWTNTSAGCSSGSTAPTSGAMAAYASDAYALLSKAETEYASLINTYSDWFNNFSATAGRGPDSVTGGGNHWTVTWSQTLDCVDECGVPTSSTSETLYVVAVTEYTLDVYQYGTQQPRDHCDAEGFCPLWVVYSHIHYDFSATVFTYYKDDYTHSMSLDITNHEECTGLLSVPYTQAETNTDIVNALAQWNLGNEIQYPVRTDSLVTQMPYVSYDEGYGGPILLSTCENSSPYTGDLIGLPGPAGIDKVWIPDHKNYCVCEYIDDFGMEQYVFYINDYGAWSTDVCHVPSATQALNIFQSNNLPQGALNGNGFMLGIESANVDPVVFQPLTRWAVKYAEYLIPKQSYNYFRPCGQDRFNLEGGSNRCVESASAIVSGTGNLALTGSGFTASFVTGDKLWICGVGDIDGVWTAGTVTSYNVQITNQQLSASNLTYAPLDECGDGMVYKLDYSPTFAPAICGTLPIFSATNSNPVTCSFTDPTYFIDGDTVVVSNSNMSVMNGTQTIKTISPSEVVLVGVNGSGSVAYIGGGSMVSTGIPSLDWNDYSSKGDFTYKDWYFNYRDLGEYFRLLASYNTLIMETNCDGGPCPLPSVPAEPRTGQAACGLNQAITNSPICHQACLPYTACSNIVIYCSPNVESFTPGSSYAIPWSNTVMDSQYGSMWQAIPCTTMVDPIKVRPPAPCGFHGIWQEDNGSCQEDTEDTNYYPMLNRWEARCAVPSGAPGIPAPYYLGCLSPSDMVSSCPPGNICDPPAIPSTFPLVPKACGNSVYEVAIYNIPWVDYLNRLQCVCGDGRWSELYQQNGIYCIQY